MYFLTSSHQLCFNCQPLFFSSDWNYGFALENAFRYYMNVRYAQFVVNIQKQIQLPTPLIFLQKQYDSFIYHSQSFTYY